MSMLQVIVSMARPLLADRTTASLSSISLAFKYTKTSISLPPSASRPVRRFLLSQLERRGNFCKRGLLGVCHLRAAESKETALGVGLGHFLADMIEPLFHGLRVLRSLRLKNGRDLLQSVDAFRLQLRGLGSGELVAKTLLGEGAPFRGFELGFKGFNEFVGIAFRLDQSPALGRSILVESGEAQMLDVE